jgi:hypothetical protein
VNKLATEAINKTQTFKHRGTYEYLEGDEAFYTSTSSSKILYGFFHAITVYYRLCTM